MKNLKHVISCEEALLMMAETQVELIALKDKFTQELRLGHYGITYMLMGHYVKFLSPQIISGVSNMKRCYLHHIHAAKLVHPIRTGYVLMLCSHSKKNCKSNQFQIWGPPDTWNMAGEQHSMSFSVFFVIKQVPIYFNCLGECFSAVLL